MTAPPSILQDIVRYKEKLVASRQQKLSLADLKQHADGRPPLKDFAAALLNRVADGQPAVIAECKQASPSKGVLRSSYDVVEIAQRYEAGGAACLSVLTDEHYFRGSDEDLTRARNACGLPVLRKDFIVDAYQIYEAHALGADCILLILAILDDLKLQMFTRLARNMGMAVLLEVHDAGELQRALQVDSPLVGINNRNLHTFETQLEITFSLMEQVPDDRLVITESGITTRADVELMRENGVHAFLVGEAFMREPDPGAALQELFFPE